MKRAAPLLARLFGLCIGASLTWYGYSILAIGDSISGAARWHAAGHSAGDPSKAAAGGSLVDFFSQVFGWVAVSMGVVLLVVAAFPWEGVVRKRSR